MNRMKHLFSENVIRLTTSILDFTDQSDIVFSTFEIFQRISIERVDLLRKIPYILLKGLRIIE